MLGVRHATGKDPGVKAAKSLGSDDSGSLGSAAVVDSSSNVSLKSRIVRISSPLILPYCLTTLTFADVLLGF